MGISNEVATRVIAEKLKEIKMFYEACYPKADYLTMSINKDYIMFNNRSWEGGADEENFPINYYENLKKGEEHD